MLPARKPEASDCQPLIFDITGLLCLSGLGILREVLDVLREARALRSICHLDAWIGSTEDANSLEAALYPAARAGSPNRSDNLEIRIR